MTCILVLGTGRCGTSAIAGALHKLGVNMGAEFMPADENNPHGTYEDLELFQLTQRVLTGKAKPADYITPIRKRNEQALWGIKDPHLARTAHHIIPLLDDVRIVVVKRNSADTINSYMRAYGYGRVHANEWYNNSLLWLSRQLLEFDGPTMEVNFDDEIETTIGRLVEFLPVKPTQGQIRAAIEHIVPEQKRDVRGWGSLAVGVRIAKHPEPAFFVDWSALLTGGLSSNDKVLLPQSQMPAHWAANRIARDFLRTNKDSLLMVDDDMTFAPDAVRRLRQNADNFNYDVVMAFATHRVWPPRPVVMWLEDEKAPPQSLRGDHYTMITNFKDGDVVEVDALGLAFTLIRRRVLEAMVNDDWGIEHSFFFGYDRGVESDDIGFCRRCRQLGFRMAIDTGVKIGHIGARPLGWHDYQRWLSERNNDSVDIDGDDWQRILSIAAAQGDSKAKELLDASD